MGDWIRVEWHSKILDWSTPIVSIFLQKFSGSYCDSNTTWWLFISCSLSCTADCAHHLWTLPKCDFVLWLCRWWPRWWRCTSPVLWFFSAVQTLSQEIASAALTSPSAVHVHTHVRTHAADNAKRMMNGVKLCWKCCLFIFTRPCQVCGVHEVLQPPAAHAGRRRIHHSQRGPLLDLRDRSCPGHRHPRWYYVSHTVIRLIHVSFIRNHSELFSLPEEPVFVVTAVRVSSGIRKHKFLKPRGTKLGVNLCNSQYSFSKENVGLCPCIPNN